MVDLKTKQGIDGIEYCIRCCVPETQEGVSFDDLGVCTACPTYQTQTTDKHSCVEPTCS